MATRVPTLDGPSDAELISAVRGGDADAYGDLFARHVEAARRLARQLVPGPDVDDLVSEAFAKVLSLLQRGAGPDLAFRAYLLTAVRRLHVDRIRSNARLHTTDDLAPFDPGVPFRDTAVEGFENQAAARAFASLPERWQLVLWHTEVEGQKPAEVAPLLGMSANSVSALAYRAREGLRQAFVSMHAQDVEDDACARTRASLGAYVRGGLSRRDSARVEQHLAECRPCTAIYLELTEVNSNLRALLAPLLLGAAATGYLAAAAAGGAGAAMGGMGLLLDRVRDAVVAYAPTTAVAGAAATAVVAAMVLALTLDGSDEPTAREAPPGTARSTPPDGVPGPGGPGSSASDRGPATPRPTGGALEPAAQGGPEATSGPTGPTGPSTEPSTAPTAGPTDGPTPGPTAGPPAPPPPPDPSPGPPSSPPQSPIAQLGVHVSVGPDAVTASASAGAAGAPPLPAISASVPLPDRP